MNDILGVLKHQYKNIDISYNKIIPRVCRNGNKNELFVTINNEKLDCNHSLGFYMQAVEKYIK
ncbi:DUF4780 domain-containing protein [Brachyspira hyodysenteriae]|uniref:DUF4780 domain-containing protein n=2 Tax=Brachyspira hyodysenteriae TaxID=159 RepID=UPI0021B49972|nr:DUF4780 domain-containing protein [Brachyspira hyodysenteriae]